MSCLIISSKQVSLNAFLVESLSNVGVGRVLHQGENDDGHHHGPLGAHLVLIEVAILEKETSVVNSVTAVHLVAVLFSGALSSDVDALTVVVKRVRGEHFPGEVSLHEGDDLESLGHAPEELVQVATVVVNTQVQHPDEETESVDALHPVGSLVPGYGLGSS